MKKLLLIVGVLVQATFYGQSLLNGGFEEWTSVNFDDASGWVSSNWESIAGHGVTTVAKVTGQTGFAYRMETKVVGGDTISGYLLNSEGDLFAGEGGWPYSQQPSSITGHYRYNLPANDTALLIVIFKAGGSIISQDIFKIKGNGSQSTFAAFSFPLSLNSMPDSVLFAAASSNLMSEQGIESGSFLEIDGLEFAGSGVTQIIPNGSFETWTVETSTTLNDWKVFGLQGVSRTTDAYVGSYALRLENNTSGGGVYPSIITSALDNSGYGLPYTNSVDTLCGYYKYTVVGATDSAFITYLVHDTTVTIASQTKMLYPTSNYTYFEIPIATDSTPTSITLIIGSSLYEVGLSGSVLYLDKLMFKSNPTASINEMAGKRKSISYPNPANEVLNISFGAALSGNLTLSVYDVTGKVVKKENISNASVSVQIKTDALVSGVYFYELTNGKETVRDKFIKK